MHPLIEATRNATADKSGIHIQTAFAQREPGTTNKDFRDKLRFTYSESTNTHNRVLIETCNSRRHRDRSDRLCHRT